MPIEQIWLAHIRGKQWLLIAVENCPGIFTEN